MSRLVRSLVLAAVAVGARGAAQCLDGECDTRGNALLQQQIKNSKKEFIEDVEMLGDADALAGGGGTPAPTWKGGKGRTGGTPAPTSKGGKGRTGGTPAPTSKGGKGQNTPAPPTLVSPTPAPPAPAVGQPDTPLPPLITRPEPSKSGSCNADLMDKIVECRKHAGTGWGKPCEELYNSKEGLVGHNYGPLDISFDFGAARAKVTKIKTTGSTNAFSILVSEDGEEWTTEGSGYTRGDNIQPKSGPIVARFVRLQWKESGKTATKAYLSGCEPPCTDVDGCGGHGSASWGGDHCRCTCNSGFAGKSCEKASCDTFTTVAGCDPSYCSWAGGQCLVSCGAGETGVKGERLAYQKFSDDSTQILACPTGMVGEVALKCEKGVVMVLRKDCDPGEQPAPVGQAADVSKTGLTSVAAGCSSISSKGACLGSFDGRVEWSSPCCWKSGGFSIGTAPSGRAQTHVDTAAKCRPQVWVEPVDTARDYGGNYPLSVQTGYTCAEVKACSKVDGTGASSGYPCKCGDATCASGTVCEASTGSCLAPCKGIPASARFAGDNKCEHYGKALYSHCNDHFQTDAKTGFAAAEVCAECGRCFMDNAKRVSLGKWAVTVSPVERGGSGEFPSWTTTSYCGLAAERFQVRTAPPGSALDPTALCGNLEEGAAPKGTRIVETTQGALLNTLNCQGGSDESTMFVKSAVFTPGHLDCACPLFGCDGCWDGSKCVSKDTGASPLACAAEGKVWCNAEASCSKQPLKNTCTALSGTGWNKPCTILHTDGLVGDWYKTLDVSFDFGADDTRITGIESNKGGYDFHTSADGKTWTKVGNYGGGHEFDKPVVSRFARLTWAKTGSSVAIAQIIGCGSVDPKPTVVCTARPAGYECDACAGNGEAPCESMSGMAVCIAGKCGECVGGGVSAMCPTGKNTCYRGRCVPFDPLSPLVGYKSKKCGPRGENVQVCSTGSCTAAVPTSACASGVAKLDKVPAAVAVVVDGCEYSEHYEYNCASTDALVNVKAVDNLKCGDQYLRSVCTCESGKTSSTGRLTVSSVCLPGLIAGAVNNVFQGPQAMHQVADKSRNGVVYFAWTEDLPFGESESGDEGKIHLTKVAVQRGAAAALTEDVAMTGFARNGGIDMTDDGTIGVLCAKYIPGWVRLFRSGGDVGGGGEPLAAAVCEVSSATMQRKGAPWLIAKHYTGASGPKDTHGYWGTYSHSYGGAMRVAGSGYLTYAPSKKAWSVWYGANVGSHLGYAMHSFEADAAKVGNIWPDVGIEERQKFSGGWTDHNRQGTGDHSEGGTWRYHPKLGDIGLMKHTTHSEQIYMQNYGFSNANKPFSGGHNGHRLDVIKNNDPAKFEGSIRPCGDGWIAAVASAHSGTSAVCAKISKNADITTWKHIATGLGTGFKEMRGVRLATLGSKESDAKCERFLMGYMTKDNKRYLQEVDGNCNKMGSAIDVSAHTTWSLFQDWDTTNDGAVVWVTAWARDDSGKPQFNSYGSKPNTGSRLKGANRATSFTYGYTPGATNEAQISTYWP